MKSSSTPKHSGASRTDIHALAGGSPERRRTTRREADELLRRSEERFRALVENSLDLVAILEDNEVIRYVSPSIESMLGYRPRMVTGMKVLDLVHPEDAPRVARALKDVTGSAARSAPLEARLKHKDGSWRLIEGAAKNLLSDPRLNGIILTCRDITERRLAELALSESQHRYRLLAENVTDVIWTMDMDLNFTYVSPSVERLLGYIPEEEASLGLANVLTPASLQIAIEAYKKGLAAEAREGQPRRFGSTTVELDHVHKNGSIVPAEVRMAFLRDDDGQPIAILGVTRDVGKRKEMEQELQRSEQSYRLLIEGLNDGIIVVDAETLKVVFCNKRAAKLYEFDSPDDFVGAYALDLVHPDHRDGIADAFADDVYRQERRQRYEVRTITKQGGDVWISVLATRIEFHERVAVLLSARDITELKRAEEERRAMEQQVLLSGRLASIGELASGVAHELNNPLAAVLGFAQILASRKDLEDSVRHDAETILREAKRAAKTTQNLLSFARSHKPEKSPISINEVIERSIELHAYRMKVNNIQLTTELAPDLPRTMADFHQLQQVFTNLVVNAEQAMTEASGRGTLAIVTQRIGDTIHATFADDGPGIPAEDLERIFDPFFTTKQEGQGTGLGLSICYGIVQAHGGSIRAESSPGEGTAFVVEMPIVAREEEHEPRESARQEDA